MVEELKRRTSNFFPTPGAPLVNVFPMNQLPVSSPSFHHSQDPFFLDHGSVASPNMGMASPFFVLEGSYSLNILGAPNFNRTSSSYYHGEGHPEQSYSRMPKRISNSTPNIFNGHYTERKLDFTLSQKLELLNLGLDISDQSSILKDSFNEDVGLFRFGHDLPSLSQRLSIWGTHYRDETYSLTATPDTLRLSLTNSNPFSEQGSIRPRFSATHSFHLPQPQPGYDTPATSASEELQVDPLTNLLDLSAHRVLEAHSKQSEETSVAEKDTIEEEKEEVPTLPEKTYPEIVIKFKSKSASQWKLPQEENDPLAKLCTKHVLTHLHTKAYPEDFSSTFYKRNKHGYMFIRESSSSLKVNSSGPKSWVTIKLKLGSHETQKIKVDVKKLPVWKPINLNQTSMSRKAGKRDHRRKLPDASQGSQHDKAAR